MPAELPKPSGILFDLGGTLVDNEQFDRSAGIARLLELADNPRGLSVEDVRRQAAALDGELRGLRDQSTMEIPPYAIHRLVYAPNGITFDLSEAEVELEFWKASRSWSPEPGVETALEELQEAGLRLGVISNSTFSHRTLTWELSRHGLDRYFEFVMSSADHVVRKPNPRLLTAAAGRMGLPPGELWYLGNRRRFDVAAALAAGMGAVWYNASARGPNEPMPHAEVRNWEQFGALVRNALSR